MVAGCCTRERRARSRARFAVAGELVAVRALALDRADEALGPAVRPGVPGPRAPVADPGGSTRTDSTAIATVSAVRAEPPAEAGLGALLVAHVEALEESVEDIERRTAQSRRDLCDREQRRTSSGAFGVGPLPHLRC